jgi:uncharacterized phage-like protein YoqJ
VALWPSAGYELLISEFSRSQNKISESKLMKYQEIIVKQTNILKQSLHLENDSHLEYEETSRLLSNPEFLIRRTEQSLLLMLTINKPP